MDMRFFRSHLCPPDGHVALRRGSLGATGVKSALFGSLWGSMTGRVAPGGLIHTGGALGRAWPLAGGSVVDTNSDATQQDTPRALSFPSLVLGGHTGPVSCACWLPNGLQELGCMWKLSWKGLNVASSMARR